MFEVAHNCTSFSEAPPQIYHSFLKYNPPAFADKNLYILQGWGWASGLAGGGGTKKMFAKLTSTPLIPLDLQNLFPLSTNLGSK